jgi:hypothetical protein
MNGRSCSHWGIITWPDDKWQENVLINGEGALSKFDDGLPLMIQTRFPATGTNWMDHETAVRR